MTIASVWFGALGVFAAIGALFDAIARRLPNLLCAAMLIAGLVLAFMGDGLSALGLHFVHALLALGIGYLLFLAGIFGGGDGKFYAATAAFFPLANLPGLIVAITAAGFVLAVLWFSAKKVSRKLRETKGDFAKLPYGVAIAAGAITFAGLATP